MFGDVYPPSCQPSNPKTITTFLKKEVSYCIGKGLKLHVV